MTRNITSRTDPLNPNTDGDGLSDGNEVAGGSNPRALTSGVDGRQQ
ncbi:MAG: thrombospondin type 3 repeat-containing protein [Deltaproteobacteria bacterium]|nr:thrombospondin type 3 repeat-containing protein [Deltaproteobacteria bacterium]